MFLIQIMMNHTILEEIDNQLSIGNPDKVL